jgi:hypothetical protein
MPVPDHPDGRLGGRQLGLGGVILVGLGTSVAMAAMSLGFDQVLYAQLVLIVVFVAVLKVRSMRLTETAKV